MQKEKQRTKFVVRNIDELFNDRVLSPDVDAKFADV